MLNKTALIAAPKVAVIKRDVSSLKDALTRVSTAASDIQRELPALKLDTLGDMNQADSLRLQMAMDRLSKLMSTLSNLMKKAADTQASITQNLK